ncbi:zinc finger protein 320-like [Belonocnema kinseyi]|uniref:zinc finger protein 320-like n=1 Tax=Belonocnema kinseyi TaxID=2817044 RepID=UPI00143CCE0E|nr:zinc finger protein 320-like [Belonocnema kinseyi]
MKQWILKKKSCKINKYPKKGLTKNMSQNGLLRLKKKMTFWFLINWKTKRGSNFKNQIWKRRTNAKTQQSKKSKKSKGRHRSSYSRTTARTSSGNKSAVKTLIEYDVDETLDIKEEVIEDEEIALERFNRKYESKFPIVCKREDDVVDAAKLRTQKKQKLPKSNPEKKYECEKCARMYKHKHSLTSHQRFNCNVMPQFGCQFCNKRFKHKHHLNRHIIIAHEKKDSKESVLWHKCDICLRIYRSLGGLNTHKRAEHAAVKRQFICHYCSIIMIQKCHLSKHISTVHRNLFQW